MSTKAKVLKRIKEIHEGCTMEVLSSLPNPEIYIHAPDDYAFNDHGFDTFVLLDHTFENGEKTMSDVWSTVLDNLVHETGVYSKLEQGYDI